MCQRKMVIYDLVCGDRNILARLAAADAEAKNEKRRGLGDPPIASSIDYFNVSSG